MKVKAKIVGLLGRALVALPTVGLLAACDLVREDLAECIDPTVELRFVFEYNMEGANSFHNQVDCLSAYFFDSEGNLTSVETVTDREILADESYRMHPTLEAGDYHVVVYGGMDCEKTSFFHAKKPVIGSHYTDLHVRLDPACMTDPDRMRLHNHYYGSADFSIDPRADTRTTVEMMRNTNAIQIALQHLNGSFIDCNDFIFEIIDDNNDFDCDNNLLPTGEIIYSPWNTDNRSVGTVESKTRANEDKEDKEWHSAIAQFSTSRLVAKKATSTTLRVRRVKDGETIFKVPLVNYMLMFKDGNTIEGLGDMSNQEYLDRENSWRFVFFLDENKENMWVSTRIIINDWEVRMNSTDF